MSETRKLAGDSGVRRRRLQPASRGGCIALAKLYLGDTEGALSLYRRAKELNPNYPTGRFNMAATLAELRRLDEARAELQAGLALNPGFILRRYRDGQSDNPVFLKGRERIIEDMRKAGVPEG